MKKILYFDYWDKGYRNFLRLDTKFKSKGFQTLLLHTASLTDRCIKSEKQIEGLMIRDISFYKTMRLKRIILKENPSAIIMLNLSFILDRVIVQICHDFGISVYYLAHGKLTTIESVNTVKDVLKKETLLSKINRKNLFSIYNYILGLKNLNEIYSFFNRIIKDPTEFITLPKYCQELAVNKSFVYYQSDYELMIKEFGFPKNKVQVIGNPELDFFFNTEIKDKLFFCSQELKIESKNYVAYIDDGLSSTFEWDMEKWMRFLLDINDVLKKNSLELVVKLHPRRNIEGYKSFFMENKIKYFFDLDFKNFLYHSLFVMSHFSSVIVYALLLKKNVKSPRWGVSKNLIEQYPVGVVNYYYKKDHFEQNIFEVNIFENLIQEYLIENIGKVDGKSTDRIVDGILNDIKENV